MQPIKINIKKVHFPVHYPGFTPNGAEALGDWPYGQSLVWTQYSQHLFILDT